MPATGPAEERAWDRDEQDRLCEEQSDLLGDQIVDVYLNSRAYWSGVPAAAWDYEFDGFQVLRWLLSYRDKGRPRPRPGVSEMELAGLEPATSWVRSRRSPN